MESPLISRQDYHSSRRCPQGLGTVQSIIVLGVEFGCREEAQSEGVQLIGAYPGEYIMPPVKAAKVHSVVSKQADLGVFSFTVNEHGSFTF
jgi:hypothetical protein